MKPSIKFRSVELIGLLTKFSKVKHPNGNSFSDGRFKISELDKS